MVPAHVGIIVDGNRRWAKQQGLSSLEGHREGYANLSRISQAAFKRGVKFLSVYAFSTENWNRPAEEVSYLMKLIRLIFKQDINLFKQQGIRLRWVGSKHGLDTDIIKLIAQAEAETAGGQAGQLVVCFNYGGKLEVVEAVQGLVDEGVRTVTEEQIDNHLYAPDVPPLDLIIRTSGEQRISNFMLWRAAYAELYFTNKLWPAFSEADLDAALAEYDKRERRFGR